MLKFNNNILNNKIEIGIYILILVIFLYSLYYIVLNKLYNPILSERFTLMGNTELNGHNIIGYGVNNDNVINFRNDMYISGIYSSNDIRLVINNITLPDDNSKYGGDDYYNLFQSDDLKYIKSNKIILNPTGSNNIALIFGNHYKPNNIYNKTDVLELASVNNNNKENIILNLKNNSVISYIKIQDTINPNNYNKLIKIEYYDKTTNKYKPVKGINDLDNGFSLASKYIYLNNSVITDNLKLIDVNNSDLDLNKIFVYGKVATENDINTILLANELSIDKNIAIDGKKCPSLDNIMTKQKLINDLCNSIEEKDKIKNSKDHYYSLKKKYAKLEKQDDEINLLKQKLERLVNNTKLHNKELISNEVDNINNLLSEINNKDTLDYINVNFTN